MSSMPISSALKYEQTGGLIYCWVRSKIQGSHMAARQEFLEPVKCLPANLMQLQILISSKELSVRLPAAFNTQSIHFIIY